MVFRFYCDVSYDGSPSDGVSIGAKHEPRTYVVGGFFAPQSIWDIVEPAWNKINSDFGVPRYHGAHLNGKTYEYQGWDDSRKISYSKELLKIVNNQGIKLRPVSCGILADEYRNIINDKGRLNLGSPYLVCFKTCISHIAGSMHRNFPGEDKLEVFVDTDEGYAEAIDVFIRMQSDPTFPFRSRLGMCARGTMESIIPLQFADMVAYEVFKRLHTVKTPELPMRNVLSLLFKNNHPIERYFGSKTLRVLKAGIESAQCYPGGLVIHPSS